MSSFGRFLPAQWAPSGRMSVLDLLQRLILIDAPTRPPPSGSPDLSYHTVSQHGGPYIGLPPSSFAALLKLRLGADSPVHWPVSPPRFFAVFLSSRKPYMKKSSLPSASVSAPAVCPRGSAAYPRTSTFHPRSDCLFDFGEFVAQWSRRGPRHGAWPEEITVTPTSSSLEPPALPCPSQHKANSRPEDLEAGAGQP